MEDKLCQLYVAQNKVTCGIAINVTELMFAPRDCFQVTTAANTVADHQQKAPKLQQNIQE